MKKEIVPARLDRRAFTKAAAAALAMSVAGRATSAAETSTAESNGFARLRSSPLSIGILIYPRMDQIDFTGPFAVLSRVPDATVHIISPKSEPFRDHKGLILTPEKTLAQAPPLDILLVPGGPGQEALMEDGAVLSLIRNQMSAGKIIFSVCTGALICGAAGVLRGRRATTHWSAFGLLRYFGAVPVDSRVVVDGNLISAAGVTAGIDGALTLASLVRSEKAAQQIQLDIQYAPEPPFNAGSTSTAPREVVETVSAKFRPLTDARTLTAKRIATKLGVQMPDG
jgi:cyclohexyl-isocyanide hydratase